MFRRWADYTWLGDPSYNEKGAGALDLKVDSRDAEELVLSLDGKLNYRIAAHTVLSANLGGGYDVINEHQVDTLDDRTVFLRHDLNNFTGTALVLAGEYDDLVALS